MTRTDETQALVSRAIEASRRELDRAEDVTAISIDVKYRAGHLRPRKAMVQIEREVVIELEKK